MLFQGVSLTTQGLPFQYLLVKKKLPIVFNLKTIVVAERIVVLLLLNIFFAFRLRLELSEALI